MENPLPNAPQPGKEFEKAAEPQMAASKHEIDAQNWEEIGPEEDLEHLKFDPPRKVFDPRVAMEFTPLGTVIREVHRELDPQAQQAIQEAQSQEPTVEQEFNRAVDEKAQQARERSFRERMMEQFEQAHERELDFDR
jgi:hypothetical protein